MCTIGGFEKLEDSLRTRATQHVSSSLEGGRISPQLAHLEGKNLLVVIQKRCCLALEMLRLEV